LPKENNGMTERSSRKEIALSVNLVSKYFPGVQALTDVSVDLYAGEVLGLVGENGAGKSTLIKIIAGVLAADAGSVTLGGHSRAPSSAGIAVIYQELTIVPAMSALSNVFLGDPPRNGPWLNKRLMGQRFQKLQRLLGVSIHPGSRAESLSVAQQQTIEIMRALAAEHRVIIMDEPTASLGADERQHLYRVVDQLRKQGTSIIYISHDLDEVLRLCDRIAVMRDGHLIRNDIANSWTKGALVTSMIGRTPTGVSGSRERRPLGMALVVRNLHLSRSSPSLSFSLQKGEILGIAGLVGAGRTELLRALFGANPAAYGEMTLDGPVRSIPKTIRDAIAAGIALVPEDRKGQGLVLNLAGAENITLSGLNVVARLGIVSARQQMKVATRIAEMVGLNSGRLRNAARTLSGGNQQKLVIGKWIHRRPTILLLDEPTRGIDIGAKAEIFTTISKLADQGVGVIVVSSELEELLANCDRILIMARNRILGEMQARHASTERILKMIFEVGKVAA
jgi:ABC-type sugar transport system ATPase subunit